MGEQLQVKQVHYMSNSQSEPLTLRLKLDRLFAYFHSATETELTSGALAFLVGNRLGRAVSQTEIVNARSGLAPLPEDICTAICSLMGVPDFYLEPSPDEVTDALIRTEHARMHLWSAARDRGVEGLIARNASDDDLDALIAAVEQLPVVCPAVRRPHHLSLIAN